MEKLCVVSDSLSYSFCLFRLCFQLWRTACLCSVAATARVLAVLQLHLLHSEGGKTVFCANLFEAILLFHGMEAVEWLLKALCVTRCGPWELHQLLFYLTPRNCIDIEVNYIHFFLWCSVSARLSLTSEYEIQHRFLFLYRCLWCFA
jgi:hypothetical protein